MNPAVNRRLLVFGGNGFLGKRICQIASQLGVFTSVTSLSRSGKPPVSIQGLAGEYPHKWMKGIRWEKADIFDPESYKHHLMESTDVVHSIGIFLENASYKSMVNGQRAANNKEIKPSYKRMNTDSALLLGKTLQEILQTKSLSDPAFNSQSTTLTYISADNRSPLIPQDYIKSKREAEWQLSRLKPELYRTIFMRPGIMYDENSRNSFNLRNGIVDFLSILNCTNKLLFHKRFETINNIIRPPVSTQQVARSLVSKLESPTFSGIVTLENILEN